MRRLLKGTNGIWLVMLFGLLFACGPDTQQDGSEQGANDLDLEPKQTNRYFHLAGLLNDKAITMELIEETDYHNEYGRYFRGFYRYDQYGGPIAIFGNLEGDNQLVLTEQRGWDSAPHFFQGKWDERGNFNGQWLNGNGVDTYDFRLAPDSKSVPLECLAIEDSLAAFPHWQHSPTLLYGAEWLRVKDNFSPDCECGLL